MARGKARELAFKALFQAETGASNVLDVWREVRSDLGMSDELESEEAYGNLLDNESLSFAEHILKEFEAHKNDIDEQLEATITGWSFSQMAQTDLNLLRLALTEYLYLETPKEVLAETTVRLAKRFGGEESGRFVHGVLGKLFRDNKTKDDVNNTSSA